MKKIACILCLCSSLVIAGGNDWMSQIAENTRISRLTIPGTHNSGADASEPLPGTAICQNTSITEQLGFGVRFLDIRCRHTNNTFDIYHGPANQDLTFAAALTEIYTFLDANPSECVIMSIKEEHTPSNNTRSFAATFNSYASANPGKWWLGTTAPNLKEVRSKIILVRRFGSVQMSGINATKWSDKSTFKINNIRVQDHYVVKDKATKWTHVTDGFKATSSDENPAVIHLNFTSGYMPGLFGIPNTPTVSRYINQKLEAHFAKQAKGQFGCVIMDFANKPRCQLIYGTNTLTRSNVKSDD